MEVNASTYMEIETNYLLPPQSDCPDCKFEIYYKGHPAILNHDSLDPRVIIIDDN